MVHVNWNKKITKRGCNLVKPVDSSFGSVLVIVCSITSNNHRYFLIDLINPKFISATGFWNWLTNYKRCSFFNFLCITVIGHMDRSLVNYAYATHVFLNLFRKTAAKWMVWRHAGVLEMSENGTRLNEVALFRRSKFEIEAKAHLRPECGVWRSTVNGWPHPAVVFAQTVTRYISPGARPLKGQLVMCGSSTSITAGSDHDWPIAASSSSSSL